MNFWRDKDHRAIVRIAWPLIVSNLSVPLLGMVDTAVMGHLPDPRFLGAVAIGAAIFSFLFVSFNFLRMGTTGVIAQAHGAADHDGLRTGLAQAVIVAFALGLSLILLQVPLRSLSLFLLSPDALAAPEVGKYFTIRIFSAPFTLINFALIGWFIGMQSGRGPLYLMLTINVCNIVLDLLFVVGLGMTTAGVALASLLAECLGSVFGLWLASRQLRGYPGQLQTSGIFDRASLRRMFTINGNLFIRTGSLMFAFAFLTAQSARLGPLVLAANAVLIQFQYLMAYGLDGFANAAEALVGRAIGARDGAAFGRAVRVSLAWSLAVALVFSLTYLAGGRLLIDLLTVIPGVRATAYQYLPWMIASPLISVWCFLYDGVYVGGTRAREMRNTMLLSTFLVYVPAFFLLRPVFGNHGLWLAFLLFMMARGLSMHWLYKRIAWC